MCLLSFGIFRKAFAFHLRSPFQMLSNTPGHALPTRLHALVPACPLPPQLRARPAPHDSAGLPKGTGGTAGPSVSRRRHMEGDGSASRPDSPASGRSFSWGRLGHLKQASPQQALVTPRHSRLLTPRLLLTLTSWPSFSVLLGSEHPCPQTAYK